MASRSWRRGSVVTAVAALVALGIVACGDDDGGSGGSGGTAVVETLATRAAAEADTRGDGLFYDTGVLSYCRAGTGFSEGVFAALGYTDADAPDGYLLCYNTNADRTKVAVGATDPSGTTSCVVLEVVDGAVVTGPTATAERCLP